MIKKVLICFSLHCKKEAEYCSVEFINKMPFKIPICDEHLCRLKEWGCINKKCVLNDNNICTNKKIMDRCKIRLVNHRRK